MMLIPNLSRLEGKYIDANSKPILHIIRITLLFCASIDKLNNGAINNIDRRYLLLRSIHCFSTSFHHSLLIGMNP